MWRLFTMSLGNPTTLALSSVSSYMWWAEGVVLTHCVDNFCTQVVLVEPLDFGSNKISVFCKPDMGNTTAHLLATSRFSLEQIMKLVGLHYCHDLIWWRNEDWRGPRVVSDQNVARLTRQVFQMTLILFVQILMFQIALHCPASGECEEGSAPVGRTCRDRGNFEPENFWPILKLTISRFGTWWPTWRERPST